MTELAPWVGRICAAIALDKGADAMQETFIVMFRNLVTLREPAALRAWVRRIAVRESLRMIGAHRELATAEAVFDRVEPDGWADMDTPLQVRAVLDELPPAHRAVLVLRDLEDLSEQETAEALGVEVGTVKSRLHRARVAFRQRWRP